MRWGLTAVCVALPALAHAQSRPVTVGGYVGMQFLPEDVELGNSWAPDQVPESGPAVGGRVTWWALPEVAGNDDLGVDLGLEGELQFAWSSTGSDLAAGRKSYASPILGTGAHLIAALDTGTTVRPHLLVGGGANTMFTRSPFAKDDTDPVVYWGLGAQWALGSYGIRVDLRQGVEAARMGGVTSTFTCVVAFEKDVTARRARRELPDETEVVATTTNPVHEVVPPPPPPPKDTDGDGIADAQDKCPDAAEDKDGFQDQDGCPDDDNDGDGIADAQDKCPNDAETINGFQDDDGCPDTLPPELAAIDGPAPAITYARNKAKLTAPAKKALDQIAATLSKYPKQRLLVTGHAGKGVSEDLSRRRAEAVKWYLIDAGVAADRIDTSTAAADPANPGGAGIELHVMPAAKS